ncbi:G-protein coupled receptor 84-like [Sinocyclocheilus rhinocerous]|uniref:G-protein coupled receptor 84-like n=1 Tax=Sinocyclocheilus rhinocerous TaxID=307959 RepID=A0A673MQ14_9TELE|nr:PREDICTED: G-protein coupled receptor 84-like [Sinocyclocheilus rhinocerous]
MDTTAVARMWNDTDLLRNDTFSCASPSVEGYRYFGVLLGSTVTIVGTIGNILTVLAFATDASLRTRFNVLIVNLALADLLYCTILQPVSADSYLHLHWRGGATWCRMFGFLLFLSNSVSIITLCLIALSRYLVVAHRTSRCARLLLSHRGVAVLLISSWLLGVASFAPLWPVYVFAPQVCTCSFHRTKGRPYTTVLLFLYFFLGLGCVGLFYFLIYRKVRVASKAFLKYRPSRRSSERKRAKAETTTDDSGISAGASTTQSCEISHEEAGAEQNKNKALEKSEGHTSAKEPKNSIQDASKDTETSSKPTPVTIQTTPAANSGEDSEFKRVTRMCFTVFLCFVGCFAPFLLLNVADKANRAPQVIHMFCANLTWLNSCINPLLYAAMNRQFNQAYKDLLGKAVRPLTWIWRTRRFTIR